jgi:hypothetical protein
MLSSGSGISSVVHQLFCFGVGFLVCWFTWGLFLCLPPFLWGKANDLSTSPLLSVGCDGLLIVFQFCSVVSLWILFTGSRYELCGLLPALLQALAYHPPAVSPSAFPAFVYWKFGWRSAPCSPPTPFSGVLSATLPLFVILGAHLFGLLNVSQAGLDWHLVVQQLSCFLSLTWHGDAFHGLGVQGVETLILLSVLFPQSMAQVSQQGLESWSSCCLLLCPSCHLLISFYYS